MVLYGWGTFHALNLDFKHMRVYSERMQAKMTKWTRTWAYHSYRLEKEHPSEDQIRKYGNAVLDLYNGAQSTKLLPPVIQKFHARWFGTGRFRTHQTRPGIHMTEIDGALWRLCDELMWRIDLFREGNTNALNWDYMAQFHHDFEEIHPFADGNGRTGRALLAYVAAIMNVQPPLIFAKHREQYISAMMYGDIPTLAGILRRGSEKSDFPLTLPY